MEITPKKLKPRSDPNIDKIQKERSDANRAAENATITRDMVRQEEIKYINIIREALRCDELRRNQLMCEELYTERPLGVSTLINAEAFPKQLNFEPKNCLEIDEKQKFV